MPDLILIDFPAEERVDPGLDMICEELGWSNILTLVTDSDADSPSYQGTLSIKCAFGGREIYEVDGRSLPVDSETYLILNQGQRYASHIPSKDPVRSLCVFFHPGFADAVLRDLITPDDRLLDEPSGRSAGPVRFAERLYRDDDLVTPLLREIYTTLDAGRPSRGWIEDRFHLLLPRMLGAHRSLLGELRRIPAARPATRLELHRRLELAIDYIHSNFARPIGLEQIAGAAHLSPHHFLRLFKSMHGVTPHQYLTRIRLERARQLLRNTDRSITQICYDVGFESPTSFSLLFRRHFGGSPRQYRREPD